MFAICDALVLRVLEITGRRIASHDRSRFKALATQDEQLSAAHVHWPLSKEQAVKHLNTAWDSLPVLMNEYNPQLASENVATVLQRYTVDLLTTGTRHSSDQLKTALMRLIELQ